MRNADMALYGAKADGRGTYRFFEPEMNARMKARRELEMDLRNALAGRKFELHYQPLVNLETKRGQRLRGAAALEPPGARHDLAGRIHPDRRGDRADRAARRMGAEDGLRRGGQVARSHQGRGQPVARAVEQPQPARPWSPRRSSNPACRRTSCSSRSPKPCCCRTPSRRSRRCTSCASSGVQIALDDFGTGYSSLELSAQLPVRQDQDRPLVHPGPVERLGAGRHRARGRQPGQMPQHDLDRRGRGDAAAARYAARRSAAPRCRAICSAKRGRPRRSGSSSAPARWPRS